MNVFIAILLGGAIAWGLAQLLVLAVVARLAATFAADLSDTSVPTRREGTGAPLRRAA